MRPLILSLIYIISTTLPACAEEPVQAHGEHVNSACYRSPDGKTARVYFDLDRDRVTVVLSDGRRVMLPRALSASGARYSDGRDTFWEHQGQGRFLSGDSVLFEGTVDDRKNCP